MKKVFVTMLLLCMYMTGETYAETVASQGDVFHETKVIQNSDVKNEVITKNIYHGISIYTTMIDSTDEYNKAILDAKRNAVEQADTYIEIKTEMKNFEITNDDVKVMSSAVVRMLPNTLSKKVIDDKNGIKK